MNAQIDKTKTQLQIIEKKLKKLQTLSTRPKALRLYEPRIQKVYVFNIMMIIFTFIVVLIFYY